MQRVCIQSLVWEDLTSCRCIRTENIRENDKCKYHIILYNVLEYLWMNPLGGRGRVRSWSQSPLETDEMKFIFNGKTKFKQNFSLPVWASFLPFPEYYAKLHRNSLVAQMVESACNEGEPRSIPGSGKWQPMPVFLSGKSHGRRSLAGYSTWGCKELDTTEETSLHASTGARPP